MKPMYLKGAQRIQACSGKKHSKVWPCGYTAERRPCRGPSCHDVDFSVGTHEQTSRDARERAYSALGVGGGSGGLFSTADAWSELFDANVCSSLSAFCFLTSFSTARVHLVFVPMNNSRRSMRLQSRAEECVVLKPWQRSGVGWNLLQSKASQRCTASIASLLVLHRGAHGAEGARDDQARPGSREVIPHRSG